MDVKWKGDGAVLILDEMTIYYRVAVCYIYDHNL